MEYTKFNLPAALMRSPTTGLCINHIEATQFSNIGELLIFDSLGIIDMRTSATPATTIRGSYGTATAGVLKNMPLGLSWVVDSMKVVHNSGNSLNDANMSIKLYRAEMTGNVESQRFSIEEGMNPKDPHSYILDFDNLNWLVDPYFGISFDCSIEGTYGISFGVKMVQGSVDAVKL